MQARSLSGTVLLACRHTPEAQEFQRIVEVNLAEVRVDYMQSAQQGLDATASSLESNQTDTRLLKSPRPVKVALQITSLLILLSSTQKSSATHFMITRTVQRSILLPECISKSPITLPTYLYSSHGKACISESPDVDKAPHEFSNASHTVPMRRGAC